MNRLDNIEERLNNIEKRIEKFENNFHDSYKFSRKNNINIILKDEILKIKEILNIKE